jgi:hypothetical protein
MAAKKKAKTKQTKSKTTGRKKVTRVKSAAMKRKTPKNLAKKKYAPKKALLNRKANGKKKTSAKTVSATRKQTQERGRSVETEVFSQPRPGPSLSGGQSGDLQGLSRIESADSESVDELIEEGNAFEADVVSGVEGADNADEQEVRTHEVPEDDVPDEYLDKD